MYLGYRGTNGLILLAVWPCRFAFSNFETSYIGDMLVFLFYMSTLIYFCIFCCTYSWKVISHYKLYINKCQTKINPEKL